jgi:hypothetical protein
VLCHSDITSGLALLVEDPEEDGVAPGTDIKVRVSVIHLYKRGTEYYYSLQLHI